MLPRFQHILVPLDFTEKNRAALDIAFEIAVQNHAKVTLLHVVETIDHVDDGELQAFYDRLERQADSEMDTLSQRFAQAGLAIDRKIRFGKRAEQIVLDADERGIDLIVMSSHTVDRGQPSRNWGTVSYQVSILCRCPVLLVK